jgi:hypothetical protein
LRNSRTRFGSVNWYLPVIVDLPTTSNEPRLRGNMEYVVIGSLSLPTEPFGNNPSIRGKAFESLRMTSVNWFPGLTSSGRENMPIYWVWSYYGKAEKASDYFKWLNSDEAKRLAKEVENETGIKYLNTYAPILGFGEYDAEDWWLAPDWAALDKVRASKALDEWTLKTWDMIDQTRPQKARMMRTASEVQVIEPTK